MLTSRLFPIPGLRQGRHRHEGGAVHENPRVSIDEVLVEIENRFRVKGVLP
jgi:hypothetical protein